MGFQFRLKAVQKIQEFHRDTEKQGLAELLQEQNEMNEKMDDLQKKLKEIRSRHTEWLRSGNPQPDQLLQFHQFEARLTKMIQELFWEQNQLQTQIEEQRINLLKSETEVKKFEKLEEKQREVYRKTHSETQN